MSKLPIILLGASGRMGKEVALAISTSNDFVLVAACSRGTSIRQAMAGYEGDERPVIIDFSSPDALEEHVRDAESLSLPIAVCVSGVNETKREILKKASSVIPVLNAPNTSLAANLLAYLSAQAARILIESDIEICEAHHRHKKDSPSGLAHLVGEHIAKARNMDPATALCFNRHESGVRKPSEIGIFGLRGGSEVGTHTAYFFEEGESLEITHRAQNRTIFANGALQAARFLARQPAGLYSMFDLFKMDSL